MTSTRTRPRRRSQQPAEIPAIQPQPQLLPSPQKDCSAAEWCVSLALSAVMVGLLLVRLLHAGGLWRDECATVQVALTPDANDIYELFPHAAFPPPYFWMIRGWGTLFGDSDLSFRLHGFCVGLLMLATFWWSARALRTGVPLMGLALIGLNTAFLEWGTTVRAYGLGCVLILATFTLFALILERPTWGRILAACITAILGVQGTLHNAVLLLAIGLSASLVAALRKRFGVAAILLGIGGVAALSLAPWLPGYASGNEWNMLFKEDFTSGWYLTMFRRALGAPVVRVAGLAGTGRRSDRRRAVVRAATASTEGTG